MIEITRRIEWDMAHRLGDGYKSKCAHLHGHRYVAELTFTAPGLDQFGMVLDFGEIKKVCGGWIDDHLDHGTIVCEKDMSLRLFTHQEKQKRQVVEFNTTVENIVPWLAGVLQRQIDSVPELCERKVQITCLTIWETPNGRATWRRFELNE